MVEAHGGEIRAENLEAGGVQFEIWLPDAYQTTSTNSPAGSDETLPQAAILKFRRGQPLRGTNFSVELIGWVLTLRLLSQHGLNIFHERLHSAVYTAVVCGLNSHFQTIFKNKVLISIGTLRKQGKKRREISNRLHRETGLAPTINLLLLIFWQHAKKLSRIA